MQTMSSWDSNHFPIVIANGISSMQIPIIFQFQLKDDRLEIKDHYMKTQTSKMQGMLQWAG
jgi:hypothetical protein